MIEYFVYTYGPTLAMMVLCAIFGTLGHMVKRIYVNHINDDTKRSIAALAVQFVEQTWHTIHGADKLARALETAEALLKKKGIAFDAYEMKVMIEAAVAEFNDAFKKPLADGSTADSARRVVFDDGDRQESGLMD